MVFILFGFLVVYLYGTVAAFNASDVQSWMPALMANKIDSNVNIPQPLPYLSAMAKARNARVSYTKPEGWNSYFSHPMDYYQTTGEGDENERRIIAQPERKYGPDTYTITTNYPEQSDYQADCHETRSHGEDGLTQIANVVTKIAKMLFGAFVIIVLPLILAKMFFFPVKLFILMKLLLKFALLWPFLSRVFPMLAPSSIIAGKMVLPSAVEAARDLVDYLQQEFADKNVTRTAKFLDYNEDRNGTVAYDAKSSLTPYCDQKMSCFLSKAFSSKRYITKLATSVVVLLGRETIGMNRYIKFLENTSEFKECVQIKCEDNETAANIDDN